MDNLPFFQEENKDLLYNLCKDEIYKEKQYNIDESRKYYKTFGEIMKIVYKHSSNKNDLVTLNKEVLAKTIPYLNQEIESKKLKSQPMLPPQVRQTQQMQSSQMLVNQSPQFNNTLPISFRPDSTPIEQKQNGVNQDYEALMNNRESMFKKEQPSPVDFSVNSNTSMASTQDLYQKNLDARAEIDKQFDIGTRPKNLDAQFQPNVNQGIDSNQAILMPTQPNSNSTASNLPNRGEMATQDRKVVLPDANPSNMKVQDFEMSDSLIRQLHQSPDQEANLKLDLNTYQEENNDIDPKVLMERMQEENKKQDAEFLKVQKSRDNFEEAQKEANFNLELGKQQIELDNQIQETKFQESLTYKLEQKMNDINVEELKGQLDKKSEEFNRDDLPKANDINAISTNDIYEENKFFSLLKEKLFQERKYVNKENLVIINSADRDWFNTNHEHRYSFQVRFNPDTDSLDCGIQNFFKNIVSFEMVRVLMPVENFIIPFDRRIYVDYKSLPYIVLKIDEIEGLYSGTNSATNKAFANLLWDKDQTAEVVINPKKEDTAGTTESDLDKSYSRQFKRGFSSMAPMSLEKKTFYPVPLSSLNRLTLSLETPYGEGILNHPDVLNIKSISLTSMTIPDLFELSDSPGFPYNTNENIVEIEIHTFFNNRVFKIGDSIQIKGYTPAGTERDDNLNASFINREEGHFIVNLEKEQSVKGTADNEGYIQKLYIAPPAIYNNTSSTSAGIITGEASITLGNLGKGDINIGVASVSNLTFDATTTLEVGDVLEVDGSHYGRVSEIVNAATVNTEETFDITKHNHDVDIVKAVVFYEDTDSGTCKLINKSLQTHFTFKITTREEDIHSHMLSSNV